MPEKIVFKYCFALASFEFVYLVVSSIIHSVGNLIGNTYDYSLFFLIVYVSAVISGYYGVVVGLSVLQRFFKSVKSRTIIVIFYVVILLVMGVVLLVFLISEPQNKEKPSWMLLQTLVSVISAWHLTRERENFNIKK